MPRAYATCTCRHCGKTFEKELYEYGKGASKRLDDKVEWAENGGIDECPDCWKARQRTEEKAAGLTCEIRLGSVHDKEPRVFAIFGGDSYSHKDELKEAGCRWTEDYPAGKVMADLLGLSRPRKAWVLYGTDVDAIIDKAKSLCDNVALPDAMEMSTWAAVRGEIAGIRAREEDEKARESAEKQAGIDAALEELGPIPSWPESVKAKWPDGAKWNGKVYGKAGNRNVYFSGEKVTLTDEEAEAMERTSEARDEWRKKKAAIEKGA